MKLNKRRTTARVTSSENPDFFERPRTIDARSGPPVTVYVANETPRSSGPRTSLRYRNRSGSGSSSGSYSTPSGYIPKVTASPSSLTSSLYNRHNLGDMAFKRSQLHDGSFLDQTPDSGFGDSPELVKSNKKYVIVF
jgi:hypothetical protein